MTTWTNMKVNKQVEFHTNSVRTHVTANSVYGTMTLSVKELRRKLQSRELHPIIRKIYKDMLEYWEKET